jgi:Tfp pilus assembly protein PilX
MDVIFMRHCKSTQERAPRQGVASMLAMMYLVLFAVLAVGFYASMGTNAQVSHNEKHRAQSLGAAESGMDFMRYQLAQVAIPPLVAEAAILTEVHKDLKAQIEGTPNMGTKTVGIDAGATKISIPSGTSQYITLASDGSKFRAEISRNGRQIIVKVIGCYAGTTKASGQRAAVQLAYRTEEHPTDFFDNGMVAKGTVTIDTKNPIIGIPAEQAGILTTTTVNPPVTMLTGSITGDLTIMQGTVPLINLGTSVGGSSLMTDILANHVDYMSPTALPEFPTPDTSIYAKYATIAYVAGKPSYDNVFIPANMNPNISGPVTFRGVVLVKQPNKVTFSGGCSIQGVVVSENSGVGTLLTNVITFTGSGNTHSGLETLPNLPQFAELRLMGGSFCIAPGFDVKFTGNYGAIAGNIVGDRVNIQGSADLAIMGSVVALKNTLTLGTNGKISFKPSPTGLHTGLRFSERYIPLPASYDEVKP